MGLFVAAGRDSTLGEPLFLTSPNGIDWTTRSAPATGGYGRIESVRWNRLPLWDSGREFVTVGYAGEFYQSQDGITWTKATTGITQAIYCLYWSDSLALWVCVGGTIDANGTLIYTSSDGTTWTRRWNPRNTTLYGVTWSEDISLFVAVGSNAGGDAYIATSSNGTNWTERSNPQDKVLSAVCWSSELTLFCAVGGGNNDPYLVTSPNGIDWIERDSSVSIQLSSVVWNGEIFVVGTVGGAVGSAISSDGINWSSPNAWGAGTVREIAWNGEVFCGVGYSGLDPFIITSLDGMSWTKRSTPLEGGNSRSLYSVAWGAGSLLEGGIQQNTWHHIDKNLRG